MRIVVLCSSPYSETGCAMAAKLAQSGNSLVGVLTLPAWDRKTILSKLGQWGLQDSVRYAQSKLFIHHQTRVSGVRNPYLGEILTQQGRLARSLHEAGKLYGFPVVSCADQNSASAIAAMKTWQPDLAVFTGGSILRREILSVPKFGVLNAHLGLLPEIRGMSSPEWSLICDVPLGITVHFMDAGIDTGPVLFRRQFVIPSECASLGDLRNRMIAQGIEFMVEAVNQLRDGRMSAIPQAKSAEDRQFFVMHDRLKAVAERRFQKLTVPCEADRSNA
ncbi:MAG TPA: formyltransferase family protein [Terriglobales bacterium]|nr:formyltransferase family protein [Terriglobales bacterium]